MRNFFALMQDGVRWLFCSWKIFLGLWMWVLCIGCPLGILFSQRAVLVPNDLAGCPNLEAASTQLDNAVAYMERKRMDVSEPEKYRTISELARRVRSSTISSYDRREVAWLRFKMFTARTDIAVVDYDLVRGFLFSTFSGLVTTILFLLHGGSEWRRPEFQYRLKLGKESAFSL